MCHVHVHVHALAHAHAHVHVHVIKTATVRHGACNRGSLSLQPHMPQAGVSLGLTDEIVAKFPVWGHKLQAP